MTYCCIDCFNDRAIRAIIGKGGHEGDCDYCGSTNVKIYSLSSSNTEVQDLLIDVFGVYTESSGSKYMFSQSLLNDWDIVNREKYNEITLNRLLTDMFPSAEIRSKLEQPTKLKYRHQSSLLGERTWTDFADYLKHENRFYVPFLSGENFNKFFESASVSYLVKNRIQFYRSRISNTSLGYAPKNMGAPPKEFATPGRINPEGISELYLSSDKDTAIHEVRSGMHDWVTLGMFELACDVKLVDLSGFSAGSPFEDENVDLDMYLSNRTILNDMSKESARRMRRSDNPIDYLPTQYIAELVKGHGYDGVKFDSTLRPGGVNLCLFDPAKAHCTNVQTVRISSVRYEAEPI